MALVARTMRAATGEMRRYLQQKQQQLADWLAGWLTPCGAASRTDGRKDGWRPSVENVRKESGVWVVVVVVVCEKK